MGSIVSIFFLQEISRTVLNTMINKEERVKERFILMILRLIECKFCLGIFRDPNINNIQYLLMTNRCR